jgi:hypothetical protein
MKQTLLLIAMALFNFQELSARGLTAVSPAPQEDDVVRHHVAIDSLQETLEEDVAVAPHSTRISPTISPAVPGASLPDVNSGTRSKESVLLPSALAAFESTPFVVPAAISDSTNMDLFTEPVKPRLLPDNMSFVERGLWGEGGILRGIGIASPLTPEVRQHELAVRRTMLTMHQIGGFVTLGLMGATVFYGQRYLNSAQRSDRDMHQTFVAATIISYTATGLLAALSPPPLIRRDETSTTTIHKTLAWIHFAGMIVTPLLGNAINRRGSSYYDQAHVHQISAYITTAVFAASMIVITF